MAYGAPAGLERVDALRDEPLLQHYYLLPSVRGDLLAKLGRHAEAAAEFERAAALTANERIRDVALNRAATARHQTTRTPAGDAKA
jgi:predicted RNA polymerase sigma factor